MKKTWINNILPTKMVTKLKSFELSSSEYEACIRFLCILRRNSLYTHNDYFCSTGLPANYLSKIFGKNYSWIFRTLNEAGLVERNEFFCKIKKQSYKYKIPDKWRTYKELTLVGYHSETLVKDKNETKIASMVRADIKNLTLDQDRLISLTEDKCNKIDISQFLINEQVQTDETFEVRIIDTKRNIDYYKYRTKEQALNYAKKFKLTLIQDRNCFFLMNRNEFIARKKEHMMSYNIDAIMRLTKGIIYAHRNYTNNRLDTNLTNLSGFLLDHIKESNGLTEIDLVNSQFAILCHILPKELVGDDVALFKELCNSGRFYNFIQEKLLLRDRAHAKQTAFELLFSSHRNTSKRLKELKKIFPNVIGWINEYKKENGDNQFAILLQRTESRIFIDDIYLSLKEQGFFALTKHDSIICRLEDEESIRSYMTAYFDSIGFEGKLSEKVEQAELVC